MPTEQEIESKFWKCLKSDMTVMLGLVGVDDGHARPMTAQLEDGEGPIWFFTTKDNAVVQQLEKSSRAICTFASKGYDVFASVHGTLSLDVDTTVVDQLWNTHVAAWYEGKQDPKLVLLRLDPEHGEIWLGGSGLLAGLRTMFGLHAKAEDYSDRVAKVDLS